MKPDHTRLAFLVFAAVEAIAFPVYLLLGRSMWFWGDDWDFLADRTAGDWGDLFRPHGNVHPSTLPILVYRVMWNIWGLHSYRPYQLLIVVLHLVCALLIRTAMRRAGVRPWTATVVASLFVLFGAGAANILWPFQIGYVGAIVFGLAQLLLADHDGPINRRDGLALCAGIAAMLCSAVGVAMVVAVGVATFMRRGWRTALIHIAPLGLFLVWWATLARSSYDLARQTKPTPSQTLRFIADSVTNTFRALGQVWGVSVVLGALLLAGIVLAWKSMSGDELRARAAVPVALAVGAIAYLGLTGFGRGATDPAATARSRYLYVVAALVLPAIAVATDAVIRRWPAMAPVVLAVIVVGIPGNLRAAADYAHGQSSVLFRRTQLTLPRLAQAQEVPRSHVPQTGPQDYHVTIGWLLDGVASGRIPEPRLITTAQAATDNLRLSLSRYGYLNVGLGRPAEACLALDGDRSPPEISLRLDAGQRVSVKHAAIRLLPASGPTDPVFPLELDGRSGSAAAGAIRDTEFRVRPLSATATNARVCAPSTAFDPAVVPALTSPRQPDTPTFCSTAVDIQEVLARLGEGPRAKTVRRIIHDRLLPLLAKAEHSAPTEVAGAVGTFTHSLRIGLSTGKNPRGPAEDEAVSDINMFMLINCGIPTADITGRDL